MMAAGFAPEPGGEPSAGPAWAGETNRTFDAGRADDTVLDLREPPVLGSLVGARWRSYRLAGLALPGTDLGQLFVEACVLDGADLSRSVLDRAHIVDSELRGIDLHGASMRVAVLVNADLRQADLRDVDLSGAVLVYCDLRGAQLSGADLSDTVWSHTDLRGVDLSAVRLDGARGDFFWDDATVWPAAFDPAG